MAKKNIEELIQKQMRVMKCSREEAEELVRYDLELDGMTPAEINALYTPEEKEALKEAHKGAGKGAAAPGEKKARKPKDPNQMKIDMVNVVINALKENGFEIDEIVNPEREFTFIGPDGKPYAWTMKYCRNKDKGRD